MWQTKPFGLWTQSDLSSIISCLHQCPALSHTTRSFQWMFHSCVLFCSSSVDLPIRLLPWPLNRVKGFLLPLPVVLWWHRYSQSPHVLLWQFMFLSLALGYESLEGRTRFQSFLSPCHLTYQFLGIVFFVFCFFLMTLWPWVSWSSPFTLISLQPYWTNSQHHVGPPLPFPFTFPTQGSWNRMLPSWLPRGTLGKVRNDSRIAKLPKCFPALELSDVAHVFDTGGCSLHCKALSVALHTPLPSLSPSSFFVDCSLLALP